MRYLTSSYLLYFFFIGSVLDGGFAAAAEFLHSPASPLSLSSALVDAHGPSLDALLGEVDVLGVGLTRSVPENLLPEKNSSNVLGTGKGAAGKEKVSNTSANERVDPTGNNASSTSADKRWDTGLFNFAAIGGPDKVKEAAAEGALEVLDGLGKKFNSLKSVTVATFKKTVLSAQGSTVTEEESDSSPFAGLLGRRASTSEVGAKKGTNDEKKKLPNRTNRAKSEGNKGSSGPKFTIDSDDEEDEAAHEAHEGGAGDDHYSNEGGDTNDEVDSESHGMHGDDMKRVSEPEDPNKISIAKSDAEKAQALAMHYLSGLKRDDSIAITKESLPGAVLFPAIKIEDPDDEEVSKPQEQVSESKDNSILDPSSSGTSSTPLLPKPKLQHRFLVVTRERFIVLDSKGGGVGSLARVVANHHLTELLKMTFRKKDPDTVTLYFVSSDRSPKTKLFRVSKRQDFVDCLQVNVILDYSLSLFSSSSLNNLVVIYLYCYNNIIL